MGLFPKAPIIESEDLGPVLTFLRRYNAEVHVRSIKLTVESTPMAIAKIVSSQSPFYLLGLFWSWRSPFTNHLSGV